MGGKKVKARRYAAARNLQHHVRTGIRDSWGISEQSKSLKSGAILASLRSGRNGDGFGNS